MLHATSEVQELVYSMCITQIKSSEAHWSHAELLLTCRDGSHLKKNKSTTQVKRRNILLYASAMYKSIKYSCQLFI